MNPADRRPVGLLAGAGRFPISFAQKARSLGVAVSCVGLTGHADPVLRRLCWRFHWCRIGGLGRMIRLFGGDGASQVVMAGKVHKADVLYRPWRLLHLLPDWRTVKAFYLRQRADNKDDTLLLALIDEFAKDGLTFASALDLCPELLVKPGVLTRRRPSAAEQADVEFGWHLAKKMGELDVGQSVAVKELNVLAVEAVEGTDRAILRAGELCRAGGFTVVKVAKPQQDMRFDVPTVGCTTIETLHQARGRVLAIEAGKTIVLDQEETVALADRLGICIVALRPPE
jgi:UDP-2,3-diacylglucosamine hydrolase